MADITAYSGIDMGDIASISGQDVVSGGAYDPVANSGTYTEIVPTTGLIKRGGQNISSASGSRNSSADNTAGFIMGTDQVVNLASDVDGILNIVEDVLPAGMGAPSKLIYGKYSCWIIDNAGKLWRITTSVAYGGTQQAVVLTQTSAFGLK
jgi:hypothetical protein